MAEGAKDKLVFKDGEAASRQHVWLFAKDIEWIKLHVDAIKFSKFVRHAVRATIRKMKADAEQRARILSEVKKDG